MNAWAKPTYRSTYAGVVCPRIFEPRTVPQPHAIPRWTTNASRSDRSRRQPVPAILTRRIDGHCHRAYAAIELSGLDQIEAGIMQQVVQTLSRGISLVASRSAHEQAAAWGEFGGPATQELLKICFRQLGKGLGRGRRHAHIVTVWRGPRDTTNSSSGSVASDRATAPIE